MENTPTENGDIQLPFDYINIVNWHTIVKTAIERNAFTADELIQIMEQYKPLKQTAELILSQSKLEGTKDDE